MTDTDRPPQPHVNIGVHADGDQPLPTSVNVFESGGETRARVAFGDQVSVYASPQALLDALDEAMRLLEVEIAEKVRVAEPEKTATELPHLRQTTRTGAAWRTYRLSEPLGGYEYVVVSAVVAMITGPETYIFGGNARGEIVEYAELDGSFRGGLDHEAALNRAGYTVVHPAAPDSTDDRWADDGGRVEVTA